MKYLIINTKNQRILQRMPKIHIISQKIIVKSFMIMNNST